MFYRLDHCVGTKATIIAIQLSQELPAYPEPGRMLDWCLRATKYK